MNMVKNFAAAALALVFGTVAANAVVVLPGQTPLGITVTGEVGPDSNGNCPIVTPDKCWLLVGNTNNQTKTLTIEATGLTTFSLNSFKYVFTAGNNTSLALFFNGSTTAGLTLTGDNHTTLIYGDDVGETPFLNLTKVVFNDRGAGNVRMWDVDITAFSNVQGQVPLPAASLLLIGGLGGLAALKRRKKAA